MKNLYITTAIALICTLGITSVAEGQSRKYISQFSHFQNYYNPGLTGYEGSTARAFVRNQWAGFEGSPKTYFLSAELDFGELSGDPDPALLGRNAVGISLLHDGYGAFVDTELIARYASGIRLDANTNLRLGAGVNYNTVRLDGNAMTQEQAGDPVLGRYLNSFADMQILDFNLGLALTHRNYYLSYGAHNVNRGAIRSGDVFMDRKPVTHIMQAGFRQALSKDFSVIMNFMHLAVKTASHLQLSRALVNIPVE
jgi:type IX secretion system PorP/SprF family membrane protein